MALVFKPLVAVLALALLLTGCQTTSQPGVPKTTSLESALAQANAAKAAGHPDQALMLLKSAAAQYPASKYPWINLAQMRFEGGHYAQAISYAEEVLARDPKDRLANSIIAVSGLRLSTKALTDLRNQNNLSGSLKSEAQDLTKILRENLGENVLVPKPRIVRPKPTQPSAKPQAPAQPPASAPSDSNPFGGLK